MNLSQEYNNRDRVPEHPAIIAGWEKDAAAYRKHARVDIGLGYGAERGTISMSSIHRAPQGLR